MFESKCRLCGSSCALISLFNGKSRKNRDYIRKLVEITTGIKFQKDDTFKCICYPCSVQVYNFYIFKTRSKENERILEAHIKKDDKPKQKKLHILSLDDIPPPEISELVNTLAPWLTSKQKYCSIESNKCDVNSSSNTQRSSNVTNTAPRTIENSAQCNNLQNSGLTKDSKDIIHTSTQTDVLNVISLSKFTQCVIPSTVKYTQTNSVPVNSCEIQCSLLNGQDKTKNGQQVPETKTNSNVSNKDVQFNENCEDNFTEPEYKCSLSTIKQEAESSSPSCLSPLKYLSFSPGPIKVASPISSPSSNILLTPKRKYGRVIICKVCNQSSYSKMSYNLHKKTHMRCHFCKKKFPSMKQTRRHLNEECHIKKNFDKKPVVQLIKLEMLNVAHKKYSTFLEEFKSGQTNDKRGLRMRSRSTSSVESVYSCCSLCRNPLSVLHGLKLGVDKAVQTGLLFENGIVGNAIKTNMEADKKFKIKKREIPMPPSKKVKMSQSFKN